MMDFEIVSQIQTTETIAQGHGIRDLRSGTVEKKLRYWKLEKEKRVRDGSLSKWRQGGG